MLGVLHAQRVDEVLHGVHLPLLHELGRRGRAEHRVLGAEGRQGHCGQGEAAVRAEDMRARRPLREAAAAQSCKERRTRPGAAHARTH